MLFYGLDGTSTGFLPTSQVPTFFRRFTSRLHPRITGGQFLFLASAMLIAASGYGQPFPQAHAHNDYKHRHPLFDALHHGFTSVEADVYLIHGKLLVAHTRPIFRSRTLEELYLGPLDSLVRAQGGKVYPGYEGSFYLMIDIKSDGVEVYGVLKEILKKYPALFQISNQKKPVNLFLSGNRPVELVAQDSSRQMSLDGRPEDLGKRYSAALMPVVSDNFKKWCTWNGTAIPTVTELERIKMLASRVHSEGKRLRLWAIPDNATAWKALLLAGVDVINTDHLTALEVFLTGLK